MSTAQTGRTHDLHPTASRKPKNPLTCGCRPHMTLSGPLPADWLSCRLTSLRQSDIFAAAKSSGARRSMRRREFITLVGGTAAASSLWPLAARPQQATVPVVAFVSGGSPDQVDIAPFQRGLSEADYVDG